MTQPLGVLDRLLAISAMFEKDMASAFAGTELTTARSHVLWVLHHEGPQTLGNLAHRCEITPRGITGLVDALETAGYAARSPHPHDRRATIASLTELGETTMAAMQRDYTALEATLLAGVAATDRAAFIRGLDAVLATVTGLTAAEATPTCNTDSEHRQAIDTEQSTA